MGRIGLVGRLERTKKGGIRPTERKGESKKRSGPTLGWAEKRRERGREGLVFFILKTHKLKQKHATTNDAQALG
jgi:hypothetical protein